MVIGKKLLVVLVSVFAIAALFSACVTGSSGNSNNSLPEQEVFLSYLKEQFKNTVSSRALVLNTASANPVEIEVREYRLDNKKKPVIDLTARVQEAALGQQGSEITSAIVKITMNWLAGQGYDLQKEKIIPICTIIQGNTNQAMVSVRVIGRSNYDPDTNSIVWHLAYN